MWVFDFLAIWCLESLATESIHHSLFKSAGFSSELVGFRQLWWGDCPSPISHPVWTKVTGVGGVGSDGAFVAPLQPPVASLAVTTPQGLSGSSASSLNS